ncbi:DUF4198 domain-containing protein [Novosphingobium resinovorum]|uniref:DUF4198 domain-containing protein n=1 Tax=Novosphingobium resinovorum TaxID=158500 RepID=UPI002ED05586|nr:DUF4198 domain-containing protein [Novosphingobium resinovorum]
MTYRYLTPLLLALAAPAAQAHEVWIERDGTGPARIYLGEPGEALPPGGDPEFDHLKTPQLLPASKAAMARKAGYLEVAVPAGDVRAHDDTVFAPWGEDGKKEGVAYFARAGRAEARSAMPFEIAPVSAGGDRFVLVRDGKPVADAQVTVISPDKWTKAVRTDAQGTLAVPLREKGRYILTASHKDEAGGETSLGKVAVLHRIATTTFISE